jgi:hypothetical protein
MDFNCPKATVFGDSIVSPAQDLAHPKEIPYQWHWHINIDVDDNNVTYCFIFYSLSLLVICQHTP